MEKVRKRTKLALILLSVFGILFFAYLVENMSKRSEIFKYDIFPDFDTLKVKDEQTKEYKRLTEFEEVMVAVFISYNDCQTCVEAIMQDILRYKSVLNLKKENIALIVIGGSDEFLKFIRYRYAKYFNLFSLEAKIKTPVVFFVKLKRYILIEPSIESILYFSQIVDSLIFKLKLTTEKSHNLFEKR